MKITRKDFVRHSLLVLGAALVLPACGGDDDDDGSGGNGGSANGGSGNGGSGGAASGCGADIVGNHAHVLNVTDADVSAGVDKTYDIRGGAGHTHSVTVTAAHFSSLASGGSVSLTSTTASAHEHSITVTCA